VIKKMTIYMPTTRIGYTVRKACSEEPDGLLAGVSFNFCLKVESILERLHTYYFNCISIVSKPFLK